VAPERRRFIGVDGSQASPAIVSGALTRQTGDGSLWWGSADRVPGRPNMTEFRQSSALLPGPLARGQRSSDRLAADRSQTRHGADATGGEPTPPRVRQRRPAPTSSPRGAGGGQGGPPTSRRPTGRFTHGGRMPGHGVRGALRPFARPARSRLPEQHPCLRCRLCPGSRRRSPGGAGGRCEISRVGQAGDPEPSNMPR
jgi:hypothetical protein